MDKEYVCDDRDVLEDLNKIRNMTDEEFEEYIKRLKEEEDKDNDR